MLHTYQKSNKMITREDVFWSIYVVRLRHDHGRIRIRAVAQSVRQAIDSVLKAEGAPDGSVLSVYRLRDRKRKCN